MSISKRLRYEIFRRDAYICRYCGRFPPDVQLTVDHVIPEALGGLTEPGNLVTACQDCNAGKSSINPDAPLVENVANDALRWARAMEIVAFRRSVDRMMAAELHDKFLAKWNTWFYTRGIKNYNIDLPSGWQPNVTRFIQLGLTIDDLTELIDVAMAARTTDEWRYFCGCCWHRLRESQEQAREIIDNHGDDPDWGLNG